MKKQNVRTLALIIVTVIYLIIGAVVFDALESEMEQKEHKRLKMERQHWMDVYNISSKDFSEIQNLILNMKSYRAGTQWKFAGAFYFSTTVITTIGYGHSTPKTLGGKIFCMAYALLGIPLCLVMFQSIGERMNTAFSYALQRAKYALGFRNAEVSQTHLIIISSSLVTLVITTGSLAFSIFENWSYFNSIYYCFITLTTIGFGDFVALQRNNTLSSQPEYVVFGLIFIIVGLTIVSSSMNLLVLRCLTLNRDDELRDATQQQYNAASTATREFILSNGGGVTARGDHSSVVDCWHDDMSVRTSFSTISALGLCSQPTRRQRRRRLRHKFGVTRTPSRVVHLAKLADSKFNIASQSDELPEIPQSVIISSCK